jgi:hypothetical protein
MSPAQFAHLLEALNSIESALGALVIIQAVRMIFGR